MIEQPPEPLHADPQPAEFEILISRDFPPYPEVFKPVCTRCSWKSYWCADRRLAEQTGRDHVCKVRP